MIEPKWPFLQMFVLWVLGGIFFLSPLPILYGLNKAFADLPGAHSEPNVMHLNSIRPPKKEVKPEPKTPLDLYSPDTFRNDPTVLVSLPRTKPTAVKQEAVEGITITTSWSD